MPEPKLFPDLLAAQGEMPALQKSAINPHFKNRYVPLEELIPAILPILNKHNFILLQQPTTIDGQAALRYRLVHSSGEEVADTMLLMSKDDPQGQGSAITYARRYSLMSLLGLTADVDDDAETTRKAERPAFRKPDPRPANTSQATPVCPVHGASKFVGSGVSKKTGKPYSAFYSCEDKNCDAGNNGRNWTMFEDEWVKQLQLARGEATESYDPNDVPFSE